MFRSWLIVVLSSLSAPAVSPDPRDLAIPQEQAVRSRELIRRLQSDVFMEREKAFEELERMGRLAKPALLEALKTDPSPEVRSRAAYLLPRADGEDFQARLDTFLADTEGKFDHDVPGWTTLKKLIGTDKATRDFYVELLKNRPNLDLIMAIESSAETGGKAVMDRRLALYQQMYPQIVRNQMMVNGVNTIPRPQPPTIADVSALLLAEIVVDSKDIPRNQFIGVTGGFFAQQQAGMNAINSPASTPHAEVFQKILVKWLDTRTNPEDLNSVVSIAQQAHKLKDPIPLMRRVIATEGVNGMAKGHALNYLVNRNGKDEIPLLKNLLRNETVSAHIMFNGAPAARVLQVQVRDSALAHLIVLSGQQMKDYGFEFPNGSYTNSPIQNFAFTSDEKREAALKKWAKWEEAQKAETKDK